MEKRKVTIGKTATVKINTGNFENVEVTQSIETEMEFADAAEFKEKDARMNRTLADMLKSAAEHTLSATNRKRVVGKEVAELW